MPSIDLTRYDADDLADGCLGHRGGSAIDERIGGLKRAIAQQPRTVVTDCLSAVPVAIRDGNVDEPSRGGTMVILQQSSKPLTRQHATVVDGRVCDGHDQLIAQALMIAFAMIVLDELGDGSPERRFTEENHPVQAGFLDRPNEALRVCVEIRGTGRQTDDLNTCCEECLAERLCEQWIPMVAQEALASQKAVAEMRHVATHLTHPG